MPRARLRDLGINIGTLPTGKYNAITDVPGVLVGHTTLIYDEPRIARLGDIVAHEPLYAFHALYLLFKKRIACARLCTPNF